MCEFFISQFTEQHWLFAAEIEMCALDILVFFLFKEINDLLIGKKNVLNNVCHVEWMYGKWLKRKPRKQQPTTD